MALLMWDSCTLVLCPLSSVGHQEGLALHVRQGAALLLKDSLVNGVCHSVGHVALLPPWH